MRHIIIGVLILLAVTGFTAASAWYVSDAVAQTAAELEQAYQYAQSEQMDLAKDCVQQASNLWDRHGNRRRGRRIRKAEGDRGSGRPG